MQSAAESAVHSPLSRFNSLPAVVSSVFASKLEQKSCSLHSFSLINHLFSADWGYLERAVHAYNL